MGRWFQFVMVFALALPLVASAQNRSTAPPASIYSVGGSFLGPPPASIYSQPTRPSTFCCGNSAGHGQFHNFNSRNPIGGKGRHHRNGANGTVVVPYAVYPFYGDTGVEGDPTDQEIEGGGTFQSGSGDPENDPRRGPTIFENRSAPRYRTSQDSGGAPSDDPRYGVHFRDGRDRLDTTETAAEQSPRAVMAPKDAEDGVPTVLVFRDGHQREITNYAIMGKTLFVLAGDRSKIPMSDLDVDATISANEKRGVDFRIPKN